jgi:hypothetical protein
MRRTFKEYEAVWEDAAANSVAGGGVSLPADAMGKQALLRRQKKKKIYDGRTKEGKKFVERILARRAAKQAKVEENMKKFKQFNEQLSKYDFRYYRKYELELKNRAYGRDVEDMFNKAGYKASLGRGGDLNVMGTTISFNNNSKHWGTDENKLKAVIKKVLGIDVDRL